MTGRSSIGRLFHSVSGIPRRSSDLRCAGSSLAPGRWNTPGSPLIYSSGHYSTALLEKLVHGSGRLPPNQHYIQITIPGAYLRSLFAAEPARVGQHAADDEPEIRRAMVRPETEPRPHRAKRRRPARQQHHDQPGACRVSARRGEPASTGLLGSTPFRIGSVTGDWAVESAETPFPLISLYYARMFCLLSSCSARGDFGAKTDYKGLFERNHRDGGFLPASRILALTPPETSRQLPPRDVRESPDSIGHLPGLSATKAMCAVRPGWMRMVSRQ